ncbi:PREDICTED: 10 kDa heat shock protein, mitochondrial, partial [Leptosomus discolor]|uniref:10 kDa heat shock protein, mitochondrial n=1 Tax=Leptosomus discolor TaxID=188344 RepID=UPI0005229865
GLKPTVSCKVEVCRSQHKQHHSLQTLEAVYCYVSVKARKYLKKTDMGCLAGKAFRKFLPLFDRVLVERCAAETVTKGGIMIPEKAQGKVLQATVVAVGSGARGKNGEIQPVSVKVGEKVLLPEYGGTKIVLEDKDYYLFRDGDILGKYVD